MNQCCAILKRWVLRFESTIELKRKSHPRVAFILLLARKRLAVANYVISDSYK